MKCGPAELKDDTTTTIEFDLCLFRLPVQHEELCVLGSGQLNVLAKRYVLACQILIEQETVYSEGDVRCVSLNGLGAAFRSVVPDFGEFVVVSCNDVEGVHRLIAGLGRMEHGEGSPRPVPRTNPPSSTQRNGVCHNQYKKIFNFRRWQALRQPGFLCTPVGNLKVIERT